MYDTAGVKRFLQRDDSPRNNWGLYNNFANGVSKFKMKGADQVHLAVSEDS
jgi:hypothetical protein